MHGQVNYNPEKGYTVPEELAEVFDRLRQLPEETFEPPVSVS